MELLFTKNSYSHGRGIEKQIRYMQFRNNSGKRKVRAVKELMVQAKRARRHFLLAVTNTSDPLGLKIWGKIPAQGIV